MDADLIARAKAREGSSLRGKYLLEQLVGVGGMAAVYSAVHRNGMRVAIKVLHREMAQVPEVKSRFLREGYIANRINHPGVVRVIDDDEDSGGMPFIAMELLQGETIEAEWQRKGRNMTAARVATIADRLLDVVNAAHAEGIIHRDIKPDNVFWTNEGELKVFDFGIARLTDSVSVTRSGQQLGTPEFMSPEQAGGRVRDVDTRSDLFSVGAMMFTLLSGQHTHHTARGALEYMVFAASKPVRSILDAVPHMDGGIANVVDVALAFDKTRRWESAKQMQTALRNAVGALDETMEPSLSAQLQMKQALDRALAAHAFKAFPSEPQRPDANDKKR